MQKMTNKWTLGNAERKKKEKEQKKRHNKERLAPEMETKVNTVVAGLPLYLLVGREKLISLTDTEEKTKQKTFHSISTLLTMIVQTKKRKE